MRKLSFILLIISLLIVNTFHTPVFAEDVDYVKENEGEIHQFSDDDGVFIQPKSTKSTKDYSQIYSDLELPDFSYLHDIDPDQYYDMKDTAWSVYPLLRLNSVSFMS